MDDLLTGYRPFREWPPPFQAALCVTWDVDDEAPYYSRGSSSHYDVSEIEQRQYGVRRAMPAIFGILQESRIPACFFVPAYIAKRWPRMIQMLTKHRYEIGGHGFLHEPVRNLRIHDEDDIVRESIQVLRTISGLPIVGYRTPSWQFNEWTADVLCRYGIVYDSSLMGDISIYQLKCDNQQQLLEIPIHWNLDDVEYWGHTHATRAHAISAPAAVYDIWSAELIGIVNQGGVCVLTLHPHVSGRPAFLPVVKRFIDFAKSIPSLWITTPGEISRYVRTHDLMVPSVRLAPSLPEERLGRQYDG